MMCYFGYCPDDAYYKICWYDNVIEVCKNHKQQDKQGCTRPCKRRWWQRG
ncbi:hypothetical protein SEA_TOMAS_109 [Streptomyces phage Tomas]|uniref:Uncharacterized protein n=1 Tax=Streptomyces phage Tomas TaxID=2914443 RepID=A0AA49H101_9CAUD|nr:hypothetical protein PP453_gp173 [Streptomyces phage Tomas]UMO76294.1 hypothetical protein SEA_TOMAS_109 [Streptomyces phage Tomas]